MKKILLALAILPLLFVGCSSDNDKLSSGDFDYNLEMLYGNWRATGIVASGVAIDLTTPKNELKVAPTNITFSKGGVYTSEGALGEGTGKFGAKDKTILTSIGKHKVGYEVSSLTAKTAKFKVDAKAFSGIPFITEGTETVLLELTKDYVSAIDFDHKIEFLYGEWRAVSVKGTQEGPVDLTHPAVKPTYITFEKKGVLISKGLLGNGTGRYITENKTILTLLNEKSYDFEMTKLDDTTAEIEVNAKEVDLGMPVADNVKMVTVTLKKQIKK